MGNKGIAYGDILTAISHTPFAVLLVTTSSTRRARDSNPQGIAPGDFQDRCLTVRTSSPNG